VASENGTQVWAFQEFYCLGDKPLTSCITWDFFNAKDGHQIVSSSVPYP
jgi:hypothetical protein